MSNNLDSPMSKADTVEVFRSAVERGVTFFDTAEVYGPFINEELVGEALAPLRDRVAIATKFGFDTSVHPTETKSGPALNSHPEHIAERKKATPAQIALARLLAQKPWIVAIPGTARQHRMEENIKATEIGLTPDDLREIDSAASKITVQGDRYPENLEQMTNR